MPSGCVCIWCILSMYHKSGSTESNTLSPTLGTLPFVWAREPIRLHISTRKKSFVVLCALLSFTIRWIMCLFIRKMMKLSVAIHGPTKSFHRVCLFQWLIKAFSYELWYIFDSVMFIWLYSTTNSICIYNSKVRQLFIFTHVYFRVYHSSDMQKNSVLQR